MIWKVTKVFRVETTSYVLADTRPFIFETFPNRNRYRHVSSYMRVFCAHYLDESFESPMYLNTVSSACKKSGGHWAFVELPMFSTFDLHAIFAVVDRVIASGVASSYIRILKVRRVLHMYALVGQNTASSRRASLNA